MPRTENELILIAESSNDDNEANAAMKELRENYDPNYFFCWECDGLVCKEMDCCLNKLDATT